MQTIGERWRNMIGYGHYRRGQPSGKEEEDSCCGPGFISWSRRVSAVYMLKIHAQAMSFCTLLIPSLFIYTWYSVKSVLCWGALPGDHISAFGRGRRPGRVTFFMLCGWNREHQQETHTAKKHTGPMYSHKLVYVNKLSFFHYSLLHSFILSFSSSLLPNNCGRSWVTQQPTTRGRTASFWLKRGALTLSFMT